MNFNSFLVWMAIISLGFRVVEFLSKCRHKYVVDSDHKRFSSVKSDISKDLPVEVKRLLICEKCGDHKLIELL